MVCFDSPAILPTHPDAAKVPCEDNLSSLLAFGILVNHNYRPLLHFFSQQGAGDDSEDLVQETFIRLYRCRDRYRATGKFSAFLYTIARHAWIDHCRKASRSARLTALYKREIGAVAPPVFHEPGPDYDIQAALLTLSPKLHEVIDMHFYHGLRHQDIAARLGIPVGTVKSRVNLAMRKLRDQCLASENPGTLSAGCPGEEEAANSTRENCDGCMTPRP